ncbi:UNKNOWN [Stylonychia lemnae]|uniref:Uncharacterized protein n=1 Tax=Stylonychia lemnae TaxID=5949 RepID=A0A078AHI0_STYLE|nr:UNKNOWN [Stylonychia lemnae]|eukprot:CDW80952.1 UNKNOWN [Stylonychia lemnae]
MLQRVESNLQNKLITPLERQEVDSQLSIYDKKMMVKYKNFYDKLFLQNKASTITIDTLNNAMGGLIESKHELSNPYLFQSNIESQNLNESEILSQTQIQPLKNEAVKLEQILQHNSNFQSRQDTFVKHFKMRDFMQETMQNKSYIKESRANISVINQAHNISDKLNTTLPQIKNYQTQQNKTHNNSVLQDSIKSRSEEKKRVYNKANLLANKPNDYFQSKRGLQSGFYHLLCAQEIYNNDNIKQHGQKEKIQESSPKGGDLEIPLVKKLQQNKPEKLNTLERIKFDNPLGQQKATDRYANSKLTLFQAHNNMINGKMHKWMKQHQDDSQQVQLKSQLNDEKEYGKIKLKVLIKNFIALGLAANEDVAFDVTQNLTNINPSELKNKEVMLEEFISLFKSNDYEDKILKVLNTEIQEKRLKLENLQKQISLMKALTKKDENKSIERDFYESQDEKQPIESTQFSAIRKLSSFRTDQKKKTTQNLDITRLEVFDNSNSRKSLNKIRSGFEQSIKHVKSKFNVANISKSSSEEEFEQYINFKFQPTKQIDIDLIMKDYHKNLDNLQKEHENIKQSNIYEEIQQDIRHKYQTYKEMTVAEIKIESGAVIDQKERLRVSERMKQFKIDLKEKYGQFGGKLFLAILQKIFEIEDRKKGESENFSLTPHLMMIDQQQDMSTLVKRLVKEQYKKQGLKSDENTNFKFPHEKLINQVELLNEWWSLLDTNFQKEISKKAFAKFLLEKKLIKKEIEIDRVIKVMINEFLVDGTVKKTQFIKLFTKAILKGAIMNIYYYCKYVGNSGDDIVPTHLKVLKFQRNLLIGGLKNQQEMLGVDCNNVITGLVNQSFNEANQDQQQIPQTLEAQAKNHSITLSGIKEFMGRKMQQLDNVSKILTKVNEKTLQNFDLRQNLDVKTILEESSKIKQQKVDKSRSFSKRKLKQKKVDPAFLEFQKIKRERDLNLKNRVDGNESTVTLEYNKPI